MASSASAAAVVPGAAALDRIFFFFSVSSGTRPVRLMSRVPESGGIATTRLPYSHPRRESLRFSHWCIASLASQGDETE